MKFLFDDESFSFEALRAAGFANYGGADLGEIVAAARSIPDGDEEAWCRQWRVIADRAATIGRTSAEAGCSASAQEAWLRASNYYRTAEFYRRDDPASDSVAVELYSASRETFRAAAALLDTPVEAIRIPFEGTSLPGYLFLVDDSGRPRPTIIYTNGFDSTAEESYFAIAAAALARGYNVVAYDGPGQGAALREQGLVFRSAWEEVLTPVIDFAVARPEVDASKVVIFGYSMGGYLVARAAAFDSRPAAIVLDDGIYDFYSAVSRMLPPFLVEWVERGDSAVEPVVRLLMTASTQLRWAVRNGMWTFGVSSATELFAAFRDFTLAGITDRITMPALVFGAENDQFFRGEPECAAAAIPQATLITLREDEGAGEHCHVGAMSRFHQKMFDHLEPLVFAHG